MLSRSISRADAAPRPRLTARCMICATRRTRAAPVSILESSTPRSARESGGITIAHATTGPAREPRPTSSTPAMSAPPVRRSSRSIVVHRARCTVRGSGSFVLDGTGNLDLALLDTRGLAGCSAQIVELRATHAATANDVHVAEHGAVDREDALDADAVRDLANREGLAHAAAALRDAHAFERLEPLLLAFLHAHVHAQRVAGAKGRNVGAEIFLLGLDEYMHRALGADEQGPDCLLYTSDAADE